MPKDEFDAKMKSANSILNKLTPEKFTMLVSKLFQIGINDERVLQGVIALLYDKAITEKSFCEMYARACRVLHENLQAQETKEAEENPDKAPTEEESKKKVSFKKILLTRCQEEFERPLDQAVEGESEAEATIRKDAAMKRSMGNVKFVGELYKIELLTERIMHQCIRKLLGDIKNPAPEDVESLCNLMKTIGSKLDIEKAKSYMDQYFDRMEHMASDEVGLATRLRFMLKDVIELRRSKWKLRTLQEVAGPKTLTEIHRDHAIGESKGGKGRGGGKGAPVIGTPSLAHLRGGAGADPNAPPPQSRDMGAGGFRDQGGFGGRGGQQGGGRDGWMDSRGGKGSAPDPRAAGRPLGVTKPGDGGGMFVKSGAGPTSGSILGTARRGSVDASKKEEEKKEEKKISPEDYKRKTEGLLAEYLASGDLEEACESLKELKSAGLARAVELLYSEVLEKKEKDRDSVSKLIVKAASAGVVTGEDLSPGLSASIALIEDLEMDVPMIGTYVMTWCAALVSESYLSISLIAPALAPYAETGKAAKLVAKLLQAVAKMKNEAAARAAWSASGLNLKDFLHPEDRDDSHANTFATEQKIEWLFPFMPATKYLLDAFSKDTKTEEITAWLDANVAAELLVSSEGARVIMRQLLTKFADAEQSANLKTYSAVAEKYFGAETPSARAHQLSMLYEVQLYCAESNFEAGLVKRLFHSLYDNDIIEEETFTAWKEDTSETVGKRQALLHANPFLQWLAEADEESDEDA